MRWGLAAGLFALASLAGFLPAIGSSIPFCPVAFFGFLGPDFNVRSWPTLLRSASIRSMTLPAAGFSFGVIGAYQHVKAIIVAIDQHAEAALGNREFFLNRSYSIGGRRDDNIP